MIIQGINNTGGTLTYSAESVTIPSLSTVTIPNSVLIAFAQDPNVASDIQLNNLSITDTITVYNGTAAFSFLIQSAQLYNQTSTAAKVPSLGQSTMSGSTPVTIASDQPAVSTLTPDTLNLNKNITGSAQTVVISTAGKGSVFLQVSGTFSATLVCEATVDGTDWFGWYGVDNVNTQTLNTITTPDQIFFNGGGIQQFRVRCSAYVSGTAVISLVASQVFGGIVGSTSTASGGAIGVTLQNTNSVTANQGSGGLSPWLTLEMGTTTKTTSAPIPVTITTNTVSGKTVNPLFCASVDSLGNEITSVSLNSAATRALDVNSWDTLAQASVTSGQSGSLSMTATTTSAPTYATTKTNPLSSDVLGNLRVSLKDSPTNTNKFLVTADAITVAASQTIAVTNTGTFATQSTLSAETTKVIGTVNVAASQTIATTNAGTFAVQATLAAETTKVIGTVNVASAQTIAVTQATGTNLHVVVDSAPSTAVTNAGTFAVQSTGPTLTKGTQGSTGYSVQDLKDAGRNITNYFMAAQIISTATETLQSLTGYKAGAAVAATTTPAVVTSGKTYRLQRMVVTYIAIVTAGSIQVNLRANLSGVATTSSPLVYSWLVGAPLATAGISNSIVFEMPDGMEFAAGTGLGVTVLGVGATGTAAIVGYAKISVEGYEY